MNKSRRHVTHAFIFNLETNLDSTVLAAGHAWVSEFAEQVENVEVYSTHVGRINFPANVTVHELGGGTSVLRIKAILSLFNSLRQIFKYRESSFVFHHMSPRTSVIIGIPLKLMGVKQGLWYSHSHASPTLKLSKYIVDAIFSSTSEALPIKTSKSHFIGHGIDTSSLQELNRMEDKRGGIVSLGRIVPIKGLDRLLTELSKSQSNNLKVTFIGPLEHNSEHVTKLHTLAERANIQLEILKPIKYSDVYNELEKYSLYFTGTPKSVDKAAIEAAMCGCFIVSDNIATLELTGMSDIYSRIGISVPGSIESQIRALNRLNNEEKPGYRQRLRKNAKETNDLKNTISKIIIILSNVN
jgi:glycosyltransferase involved in cell wall biosynthesis